MRRYLDFYLTSMKMAILTQIQHRAQNYFFMLGMIVEPVIYLVVWTTIANEQGGSIGGYTAGALSAYYIVWTLVRNMNIVMTPYGWEARIQHGQLAGELLRPFHPIHNDLAFWAGWKFVVILFWLPLAVILTLIFKPSLHPTWIQGIAFLLAIWGAYLIRSMFSSLMGLLTFWTTRVGAIFELYFALELVLSGRLVPIPLMPEWVQRIAIFLPFQWTFFFPINALVGSPSARELVSGLGIQILWIVAGAAMFNLVWRFAIRRFSSVGN
jgi:ABC-2 type transport system permease protein